MVRGRCPSKNYAGTATRPPLASKTTEAVWPLDGVVGQERAVDAITPAGARETSSSHVLKTMSAA